METNILALPDSTETLPYTFAANLFQGKETIDDFSR